MSCSAKAASRLTYFLYKTEGGDTDRPPARADERLEPMRTDLFDFDLPAESIALRPANPRIPHGAVVLPDGVPAGRVVADLPQWLEPRLSTRSQRHQVIEAHSKAGPHRPTRAEDRATLIGLDGLAWQSSL